MTRFQNADRISHIRTGNFVPFAFGALMGALHGAAAEFEPAATMAGGMVYGAGLWLVADEVALPLLGLADPPYELGAYLIYGVSTEMLRRTMRHGI
jgi:uncharacterized membrane protein YagU involved in acid resistance